MSELRAYRKEKSLSLSTLANEFGITTPQLSRIERGWPTTTETALVIWRKTGARVGPLSNASLRDIKAVERVFGGAA